LIDIGLLRSDLKSPYTPKPAFNLIEGYLSFGIDLEIEGQKSLNPKSNATQLYKNCHA